MKKTIYAVFKTHFDYGYTGRKETVLKKYAEEIFLRAINICEKTQLLGERYMYKWTVPSYLLMKISEKLRPDDKARLNKLVENGQITCHALPFTMHTSLLDKELAENMFLWTDDYCEKYGKPFPIAAKLTDVPGHTSGIIAPLVKRGVKFLHIGKNGASPAPDVPNLFWWEDKNGVRILTMYDKLYGSGLLPPKGWKYPVYLALLNTNDNQGAQSEEFVASLKGKVGDKYEYRTASLNEFAEALLQCDLSGIPIIRGELSDTWIHGAGSYPGAMGKFRRHKRKFYELERLAEEKGVNIQTERREFYENALIFTEHTFGINVLKFFKDQRLYDKHELSARRENDPVYAFAEKSWKDEVGFVSRMKNVCDKLQKKLEYRPLIFSKKPVELRAEKNGISFIYKDKKYIIRYEYTVFGAESIHGYVKKYLTRYENWSVSDFGRMWYLEIPDKKYQVKPGIIRKGSNASEAEFIMPRESFETYGNFRSLKISVYESEDGLKIEVKGNDKDAVGYVEAGNIYIDTEESGGYYIDQIGQEINVETDVVKGSNHILWAADGYARIGNSVLRSFDAPLISFGKNAICRYNGGKREKYKPSFCVNLFNNHWGTNFPQWIEGSFSFELSLNTKN